MSDTRWIDVEHDLTAAARHFESAVLLFEGGGLRAGGVEGHWAEMALMHLMQSGHTSAEAAMRRVMTILGENRPVGEDWHELLIRRLAQPLPGERPALLSPDVAADLQETRRFRHIAVHAYESFDQTRALPAIEAARRLAKSLALLLRPFRDIVDPD